MTSSYFTTMLLKKLLTSSINLQCTPIKVHLFLFLILCDFNPWNACYWRLFPTFKYNFWTQFLVLEAYLKTVLKQILCSTTILLEFNFKWQNYRRFEKDFKKIYFKRTYVFSVLYKLTFELSFFCTFYFRLWRRRKGWRWFCCKMWKYFKMC